jgi:capsular exopolysaccharide synthesis family protein
MQVIAVTSAAAGDGKTVTAINLAAALARKRNRMVLLIDGDLRRPAIAWKLGLQSTDKGLTTALHATKRPLADFVEPVDGSTLSMLAGSTAASETYELLTSLRFEELISEARAQYDYVIVDTPPVVPVPDSALLSSVVDGYLVVVAGRATPRRLLGEALTLLKPTQVIGLVYNRDEKPFLGFYRSRYRQYFGKTPGSSNSLSDNAW